jgi:rubrerythrin
MMAITFNIDEVFEMAEQIERNGAKFYREAAGKVSDKAMQKMFVDLAAMEDGHLRIFQEMRKQLGPEEKKPMTFDPDNEAALYLQTMADGRGTEGRKDLATKLTGKETVREVFEIAVNAEKNSVVFYTGLKVLVSTEAGRGKIDAIITEELGHLAALKLQLAKLP